jgi:hypothetical protein
MSTIKTNKRTATHSFLPLSELTMEMFEIDQLEMIPGGVVSDRYFCYYPDCCFHAITPADLEAHMFPKEEIIGLGKIPVPHQSTYSAYSSMKTKIRDHGTEFMTQTCTCCVCGLQIHGSNAQVEMKEHSGGCGIVSPPTTELRNNQQCI